MFSLEHMYRPMQVGGQVTCEEQVMTNDERDSDSADTSLWHDASACIRDGHHLLGLLFFSNCYSVARRMRLTSGLEWRETERGKEKGVGMRDVSMRGRWSRGDTHTALSAVSCKLLANI